MIFALAGNQNCGKTTLFNQLTGSNQHAGNFPGVTVEQKAGYVKGGKDITAVDLPGIYSLSPYTGEEIITRDFLLHGKPDCIINIIDATNPERNLYLTLQLIELNMPMVLALNMMDEIETNNGSIDALGLQEELGFPVVPISASKNQGITELIDKAVYTAANKVLPRRTDFCSGAVHRAIHSVAHLVEDHAQKAGVPSRFAATKLIEGDAPMLESLKLTSNETDMVEHAVTEMETEMKTDREAALADMRYAYIEGLCRKYVKKPAESAERARSVKLDALLTGRLLAFPVFIGVMFVVFMLTFGVVGNVLSEWLIAFIDIIFGAVEDALYAYGLNPVARSLVIDGAFAGVGSVLSFLPIILTLFFFLSILEDSGYMSRVAFIMDKPLRRIGLSGRSIVPMLLGFGCTVPAVMSARTLSSDRDRRMTILLTPFMSCGAKLPVYALFTAAFFADNQAVIMTGLYFGGVVTAVLISLIMKRTAAFRGDPAPFVMELPNYRFPTARSVLLLMWERTKDFVRRAFTVIFTASMIIWFLRSFDLRLNPVSDSGISILASIGKILAPLFAPLGFGDWHAVTALAAGFTAKEAVVSTLAVLTGSDMAGMKTALSDIFTPLSALSFMTFILLYTPCAAAVAAIRREWGSAAGTLYAVLFQSGVAWVVAFAVYQGGRLIFGM